MATLKVYSERILNNIRKLNSYLGSRDAQWSMVTKMLGGNRKVLESFLHDDSMKQIHSLADSRISNLKTIKSIRPDLVTMYIKPPAPTIAKSIVNYADISTNSSLRTIEALNAAAKAEGKIHRVVVMIEMGELREGVLRENILKFYDRIFNLSNIGVIGIGTNLGCMYGIEPTYDKLIQLNLFKQLIDAKFDQNLELVSAGSSITLPLIPKGKIPKGINHYRIGESVFLGVSPLDNKRFNGLSTTAFEFCAEVLELEKKSNVPDGRLSEASIGHTALDEFEDTEHEESYRAIVDFGVLDVDVNNLTPKDKDVEFFGTTSDMTVYDLGQKKNLSRVGGQLKFVPNYMAAARLLNSKYVSIEVI
ncbi:MAG: alanine racemase [Melioribacteraceae bacterium]|nr:alanine racemase [Melioribacteraceae bacterium]MCF8265067.1 alanine racemase [Melioribacteraceae bacterium]MCF8413907.1 alanine racemase [Melioribacteraceae bacterium]MCF8431965.1 alanine racemase [Melioribacteraceae bacterium]